MNDNTPISPIPNIGHCVGERCNYWDPERGCLGVGLSFKLERRFFCQALLGRSQYTESWLFSKAGAWEPGKNDCRQTPFVMDLNHD